MHSGMLVLCPSDLAHRTTLITSNKEISWRVNEAGEQIAGFSSMLLGTLGASLLENLLSG